MLVLYAAIAAFIFGAASAWKVQDWRADAARAEALAEANRINAHREVITTGTASKFETARGKIGATTLAQVKESGKYVPPSDPALSGGFRVFHDAAASGEVPDPARVVDAAAVPAKTAADTIAENYGTCRLDQEKLKGLQDWVREQQKVN